MTSSPAPDLDELERLRLAVEDPGWVLPITALVPMTQQQTEYASALVNAAPALFQEVRAARAVLARVGELDVERLAMAITASQRRLYSDAPPLSKAKSIAAEYALLAATSPTEEAGL